MRQATSRRCVPSQNQTVSGAIRDVRLAFFGARIVFGFWSGARDLNPGPHGPEPCRRRVLECPGGFSGVRLNSNGAAFVSFCDLSEPSGSGNA
jgi:hypothetical protein